MTQYVAFHVGGHDPQNDIPVAAGNDRAGVLALAIKRTADAGVRDGGILIRHRDDVDEATFEKICQRCTDEWAAAALVEKYQTTTKLIER